MPKIFKIGRIISLILMGFIVIASPYPNIKVWSTTMAVGICIILAGIFSIPDAFEKNE